MQTLIKINNATILKSEKTDFKDSTIVRDRGLFDNKKSSARKIEKFQI